MSIVLLALVGFTACDVHEFPEPRPRVDFVINLDFDTDWEQQEEIFSKPRTALTHDIRYVVKAFPKDDKGRAIYTESETFIFLRSARDGYDCSSSLYLPVGEFDIRVWADLVEPGKQEDRFYNTTDFTRISLQGEHCGNTDERDAFRGTCAVKLTSTIYETTPTEYTIEMVRPLAKFEFITTDFNEFIDKAIQDAQTKAEAEAKKNGQEIPDSRSETIRVNIDEYKVVFFYPKFMPNVFNHFTDKPVYSAMGVTFTSSIKQLSETEASLGFDYVLINSRATSVLVAVGLYDNEGELLAMSNPMDVPIQRSFHTIVRGQFLTQKATGGVVIDPGFDDEYNVVLP